MQNELKLSVNDNVQLFEEVRLFGNGVFLSSQLANATDEGIVVKSEDIISLKIEKETVGQSVDFCLMAKIKIGESEKELLIRYPFGLGFELFSKAEIDKNGFVQGKLYFVKNEEFETTKKNVYILPDTLDIVKKKLANINQSKYANIEVNNIDDVSEMDIVEDIHGIRYVVVKKYDTVKLKTKASNISGYRKIKFAKEKGLVIVKTSIYERILTNPYFYSTLKDPYGNGIRVIYQNKISEIRKIIKGNEKIDSKEHSKLKRQLTERINENFLRKIKDFLMKQSYFNINGDDLFDEKDYITVPMETKGDRYSRYFKLSYLKQTISLFEFDSEETEKVLVKIFNFDINKTSKLLGPADLVKDELYSNSKGEACRYLGKKYAMIPEVIENNRTKITIKYEDKPKVCHIFIPVNTSYEIINIIEEKYLKIYDKRSIMSKIEKINEKHCKKNFVDYFENNRGWAYTKKLLKEGEATFTADIDKFTIDGMKSYSYRLRVKESDFSVAMDNAFSVERDCVYYFDTYEEAEENAYLFSSINLKGMLGASK